MKTLKTLLQSKTFIICIIILTIIRVSIILQTISFDEDKIGDNKKVVGTIKNINIGENSFSIEIGETIIFTTDNNFKLGNMVECVGESSLPSENANFHLFNYRKFLSSKKIYYQMNGECNIIDGNISLPYKIKNKMLSSIEGRKSSGYLKAFIMGDTSSIDGEVMSSYRYNGINHLFAISGMHITLLITAASLLNLKDKTIILLIPVLIFYLFLANSPPSMLRAVSYFLLGFINRKTNLHLNSILLFIYLTVFFLLYHPYYLYSIGFIYSFTITFFLILYKDILDNANKKYKKAILLSLIAFIVSVPINIQNNFYINLAAPVYNIFFVPLVSVFLFPSAMIVGLFPVLDTLYYLIWIVVENISFYLNSIPTILILCHMNIVMIIFYYIIIIFVMHKIRAREYIYIGVLIIVLLGHHLYPYTKTNGVVLMLDVGQGDSILIVYPYKKLVILVDVGGKYNSDNIVRNITIPTLYSLGISRIDYLVLTHGDYDHIGEANNLLERFDVSNVLMNSGNISELEEELIEYMDFKNINYNLISETSINHDGIELKFLNRKNITSENEDSLVLLLKMKNKNILLMGDTGIKTEQYILNEYNIKDLDILKVGHHGSKNSSGEHFIYTVNPNIALISAGRNNIYRHPHYEVLNNLHFCDTYITSVDGAIKINIENSMLVTKVR